MHRNRTLISGWILVLLFLSGHARAQFATDEPLIGGGPQGPDAYASWTVRPIPSNIGSDGVSVLKITASLAPDWKMYALDATLPSTEDVLSRPYGAVIAPGDSLEGVEWLGRIGQSAPKTGYDAIFEMELKWFYDEATFYAAVASVDTVLQTISVPLSVRYQLCNDVLGVCLRPETLPLEALLSVDPTCVDCTATEADLALTSVVAEAPAEASTAAGIWPFLLLAIGAGLASLLTPCVFPMIPLTVSYFTKYGHSRKEAVRLALLYGSAIVITFTAIGIVMALLVGATGALAVASNPVVNLFIALVLVGFALSLLGFYEIRMPSGLLNWANARGNEERGWIGVLFMGLTLTLVSFSCTAPFVGGLLAAAATGSWTWPLFGMVAYSATFALPFVLLALFPRALDRLPKSGAWMNSLKVVLGFVELAAAVKFFSNADLVWGLGVLPRTLGVLLVGASLVLTGLYLLGVLRVGHGRLDRPRAGRMGLALALAFLLGGLLVLPGMLGRPLGFLDAYLPPHQDLDRQLLASIGIDHAAADFEEGWMVDDIEGAFTWAEERGVPVLVDFSGWTCTNCRDMEANVFPRPDVRSRLDESFVPLRLYTDDLELGDAFHAFQMELTGTPALPTYVIVHPVKRTVLAQRSAMMSEADFVAFLDGALAAYRMDS